jgi:phytoene dehydrogenase-like protein
MIERFFRPFYSGVFLERDLATSSRMFEFTLRMFAEGDAVIPTGGMSAIPRHVASKLPEGSIRLNTPVESINEARTTVTLKDGSTLSARAIVIATDGSAAHRLLGSHIPKPTFNGTACLYFVADQPPINGQGQGLINNLCVPTRIAPSYGPPGAHLVSVSTVGVPEMSDDSLVALVRAELSEWFGAAALDWKHLRTYRIPEALPEMLPRTLTTEVRQTRLAAGLYIAGDHVATASTNGAMRSGRLSAEAILEDLS